LTELFDNRLARDMLWLTRHVNIPLITTHNNKLNHTTHTLDTAVCVVCVSASHSARHCGHRSTHNTVS